MCQVWLLCVTTQYELSWNACPTDHIYDRLFGAYWNATISVSVTWFCDNKLIEWTMWYSSCHMNHMTQVASSMHLSCETLLNGFISICIGAMISKLMNYICGFLWWKVCFTKLGSSYYIGPYHMSHTYYYMRHWRWESHAYVFMTAYGGDICFAFW